jgi:peptidoglycan-associated lipoprotein
VKVIYRRLFISALSAMVLVHAPRVARAQQAGNVELGGFLQLDRLDEATRTKRLGGGAGGRIGVFVSRRWEIEAEASYTQADPELPRTSKLQENYYIGRVNYNAPFGSLPGNAVILGAGVGGNRIDAHSDFLISPDVGLRVQFNNLVGIRFDVSAMIAPNPNSATFKFPGATPAVNDDAAYLTNYQMRVGLNFLLGNGAPAPAPMVVAPAPIDSSAIIAARRARARQDSIDRASRARQDSIDAANRRAQADRDAAAKALADARAMLQAPIYFDYDQSEIRADAKAILDSKLPLLRANPSMKVRIEGNTDSRGSNEYNMALGLRRANAARRYLESQGIEAARIEVVSYGEERPVDQGTTDEAYAKNRRDDFVITVGGDNMTIPK